MIDHSHIHTGYDLEILLGGDYFLTILHGAYDAGEIPSKIKLNDNMDITIKKPTRVTILADSAEADIEVLIPIEIGAVSHKVIIGMGIAIQDKKINYDYRYLDDNTITTIGGYATAYNHPNLQEEIESKFKTALNRDINIDLLSSDVVEFQTKKIPASGEYQDALGLYLNLNLKISPQSQAPEEIFIKRGDIHKAVSFLPKDKSFAIALGKKTFSNMANSMWHNFGRIVTVLIPPSPFGQPSGPIEVIGHPIIEIDDKGKEKTIGKYKKISISPQNGTLKVTIISEFFIDYWPDADVETVFEFTPYIENEKIKFDIKLVKFDADTGLLADILGFMIGSFVGGLIGLFFGGPVGLAIAATIGGVGGFATIEITEEVAEDLYHDDVEEKADTAGVTSAFSSFPVKKRLFSDTTDPFFTKHFFVVNEMEDSKTDTLGMSFAGNAKISLEIEIKKPEIISISRGTSGNSWEGIESIVYHIDGVGEIEIPIMEVFQRIEDKKIGYAWMTPLAIKRKESIVKEIKFSTGAILLVEESVKLQDNNILHVGGFQLIHPKNGHPYYRAKADKISENNFEELPHF